MVVIDEEKLDEIVRRAVKEEMESILNRTGKVMDYIIGVAAKNEREVVPLVRESKQLKKDPTPQEKEQTVNKKQAEPPGESRYLYSYKALASFLGCSVPTALNYKKSGRIPFVQIGRSLKFDTVEILKTLNRESRKS